MDCLKVHSDGCYVDCTFGRGGHSRAILARLGQGGRLIAIDRDPNAIESNRFDDDRIELVYSPFSKLSELIDARQLRGDVDGVLMDLGVSSPQLDSAARGFSFRFDGPLDMRMDPNDGVPVSEWLAAVGERELADCLFQLGEERYARRIARKIVETRSREPIHTTVQLAAVVSAAVPRSSSKIHPATRTFQALRIKINDELEELRSCLQQAVELVSVGGRVVVIAFHSLEDRIVKRMFRDLSRNEHGTREYCLPFRKPIRPDEDEQRANPRARSARLRTLERAA